MSQPQDQLEFFSFGPSDNYIRRDPESAPGEMDSVARVLDGMEPDTREIVRRYNTHEALVAALRDAAALMLDPGKSGADLYEKLSCHIAHLECIHDIQITTPATTTSDVVEEEIEDLRNIIHTLESEKHVLEAALYEVAEIVADSDLDATTQLAQLSMALSGVEQAGLIDGDKVGTDEQPAVDTDAET